MWRRNSGHRVCPTRSPMTTEPRRTSSSRIRRSAPHRGCGGRTTAVLARCLRVVMSGPVIMLSDDGWTPSPTSTHSPKTGGRRANSVSLDPPRLRGRCLPRGASTPLGSHGRPTPGGATTRTADGPEDRRPPPERAGLVVRAEGRNSTASGRWPSAIAMAWRCSRASSAR
jgi:hypothetical protein